MGIWNDDRGQWDIPAAHHRHSIYLPPCACQWWVSVESTMGTMEAHLDLDLAGRNSASLLQPKGRMSYAKLVTFCRPDNPCTVQQSFACGTCKIRMQNFARPDKDCRIYLPLPFYPSDSSPFLGVLLPTASPDTGWFAQPSPYSALLEVLLPIFLHHRS